MSTYDTSAGDEYSEPASRSFRTYDLASFGALHLLDVEHVVEGLIPTASLTLFAGREKGGKSLHMMDLACSVAAGEQYLGRDTIAGPVILGAAEDHPRSIRARLLTRIGRDLSEDGRPIYILPLGGVRLEANQEPERLSLTDPIGIAQLTATIQETGAVLCILDCLRELHDEEENDSMMGAVVGPLRRIAHDTGCAIVLVHHARKSGGHRGSTAIVAACDSVMEWIADDDE